MGGTREFPERPVVGVGGVVIEDGRVVLIRRGSEPLKGRWSIPGGTLELGETLAHGVSRELREETGLEVRVGELIEAFERVFPAAESGAGEANGRPQYHFVILDYLCERIVRKAFAMKRESGHETSGGRAPCAGGDTSE